MSAVTNNPTPTPVQAQPTGKATGPAVNKAADGLKATLAQMEGIAGSFANMGKTAPGVVAKDGLANVALDGEGTAKANIAALESITLGSRAAGAVVSAFDGAKVTASPTQIEAHNFLGAMPGKPGTPGQPANAKETAAYYKLQDRVATTAMNQIQTATGTLVSSMREAVKEMGAKAFLQTASEAGLPIGPKSQKHLGAGKGGTGLGKAGSKEDMKGAPGSGAGVGQESGAKLSLEDRDTSLPPSSVVGQVYGRGGSDPRNVTATVSPLVGDIDMLVEQALSNVNTEAEDELRDEVTNMNTINAEKKAIREQVDAMKASEAKAKADASTDFNALVGAGKIDRSVTFDEFLTSIAKFKYPRPDTVTGNEKELVEYIPTTDVPEEFQPKAAQTSDDSDPLGGHQVESANASRTMTTTTAGPMSGVTEKTGVTTKQLIGKNATYESPEQAAEQAAEAAAEKDLGVSPSTAKAMYKIFTDTKGTGNFSTWCKQAFNLKSIKDDPGAALDNNITLMGLGGDAEHNLAASALRDVDGPDAVAGNEDVAAADEKYGLPPHSGNLLYAEFKASKAGGSFDDFLSKNGMKPANHDPKVGAENGNAFLNNHPTWSLNYEFDHDQGDNPPDYKTQFAMGSLFDAGAVASASNGKVDVNAVQTLADKYGLPFSAAESMYEKFAADKSASKGSFDTWTTTAYPGLKSVDESNPDLDTEKANLAAAKKAPVSAAPPKKDKPTSSNNEHDARKGMGVEDKKSGVGVEASGGLGVDDSHDELGPASGTQDVELTGTFAELDAAISTRSDDLQTLNSLGEAAQLRLQELSDQRSKALETLSNVMKSISDVRKTIADNLK